MKISHNCFIINFADANGRSKSTNGKVRTDRPNGGCYINETSIAGCVTTDGSGSLFIIENRVLPTIAKVVKLQYNKENNEVKNGKIK